MEEFVSEHFGSYAGYAQLYLYHFWRHHPFDFLKLSFRKLVELEIFRVNFFLEVTGWDAVIMVHL